MRRSLHTEQTVRVTDICVIVDKQKTVHWYVKYQSVRRLYWIFFEDGHDFFICVRRSKILPYHAKFPDCVCSDRHPQFGYDISICLRAVILGNTRCRENFPRRVQASIHKFFFVPTRSSLAEDTSFRQWWFLCTTSFNTSPRIYLCIPHYSHIITLHLAFALSTYQSLRRGTR